MGAAKQIDSKGRLMLGSEFAGETFLVEIQKDGSLLLRRAVTVPIETEWFFRSKRAQELVRSGVEEASKGKLKKLDWKADRRLADQAEDDE